MSAPVISALDYAAVGRPITRCGVSLFPVYLHGSGIDIATGPRSGAVITEQPDAEVPTLVADNPTDRPVLLVAGETVIGGHQNRVLNVSVLLPAGAKVLVPVSCVEQGRWREGSEFRAGGSFATRRVRRAKVATVADNLRAGGSKRTDQGMVWQMVGAELQRLHMHSSSGALAAVEQHLEADRGLAAACELLELLGPLPGQWGVVVAHGSRVVSAELFASPAMLRAHWGALVRGFLLDSPEGNVGSPSATQALRFLHRLATASPTVSDGVGIGSEHHIRTNRMVAQALLLDDCVVHATAFALAA